MRGVARLLRRLTMAAIMGMVPCAGWPQSAVTVRVGEHADFSRVVFTLTRASVYRARLIGNLLVLTFPHAGQVPGIAPPPAHMLSVTGGADQAAIGVPTGLRAHVWQIDTRVIVDVFAGPQPDP